MEVVISKISYPSRYQNGTERKSMYFDENLSTTTEPYNLEPGCIPPQLTLWRQQ